jgi:FAD:protein FMN transferase
MRRRDFLGALGTGMAAALTPALWPERVTGLSFRPPVRPAPCFVERWSWAMGQPVHLQLFAQSERHGYDAAAAALAELRRVESRLTLFDDASDLGELNRRAGKPGCRVGKDLRNVLSMALRMEEATAGCFNPAVEPLMRAWGFHRGRASEPSLAELREATEAVRNARIELKGDHIALPQSATRLDLGGIGVGYGLDRMAAVLRRFGISSALIDVSGDCLAIGAPPGQEAGWPIDIARPGRPSAMLASVRLRDQALATSANTVSVVRYGRAVRGHVMNPDTGWPAEGLVQVSVVARSGIEADALSTAMLVSGRPAEGVLRFFIG